MFIDSGFGQAEEEATETETNPTANEARLKGRRGAGGPLAAAEAFQAHDKVKGGSA